MRNVNSCYFSHLALDSSDDDSISKSDDYIIQDNNSHIHTLNYFDDIPIKTNLIDCTDSSNDDPTNIEQSQFSYEKINVIEKIIDYIKIRNLNNKSIDIIDGENLIGGPICHRSSKVKRVFCKYVNDISRIVVLVVKKSGGVKRFKNYTGIDVPTHFIFISLHADNGTCPDDGFILELTNKLNNVYVVTDDEYIDRENFNYGDIYNGTKLTSNIGINGRYYPDIQTINTTLVRRKGINKKNKQINYEFI